MYINRASDLKGQIAAHLVWLGQSSKGHLNGAAWSRAECVRRVGMRGGFVAEPRNCRICAFLLTLLRSVQLGVRCATVLPQFAFPSRREMGLLCLGVEETAGLASCS